MASDRDPMTEATGQAILTELRAIREVLETAKPMVDRMVNSPLSRLFRG